MYHHTDQIGRQDGQPHPDAHRDGAAQLDEGQH